MPAPLPFPEPPLRDGRVSLRPWTDADLGELIAGATDPLVQHYRRSVPDDAEEGQLWLAAGRAEREHGRALELAICAADDPAALGSIALFGLRGRSRDASMSWWMGAAGRGRGLAAGAVRLLAGWALAQDGLALARIVVQIEEDNEASRRLAERCGFVREGRLRSYLQRRDGVRVDAIGYSLLPGELTAPRT